MTRTALHFCMRAGLAAASLVLAFATCAAPFAYVPSPNRQLSVVDTAVNQVVATLPTGTNPYGIAVSPAGHRAYVTNVDDGTVTVVDTLNLRVLTTIAVGTQPIGIQASPDGRKVAVATFGPNGSPGRTISIIDIASNQVSTIGVGLGPTSVAYNASGSLLFTTNLSERSVSVVVTARGVTTFTLGVDANPIGIVANPSGSRLYVMHTNDNGGQSLISVIDAGSQRVIATIPLSGNPQWLAVSPDGSRLYAAIGTTSSVSVIDTSTNQRVFDFIVSAGGFPTGVAVSPDGSRIVVVDGGRNELSSWSSTNFVLLSAVSLPANPAAFGDFLGPQVVGNGANSPGALSGIWFNPNESGWGIDFTQRGNNIFAAWYTYDSTGKPKWYVAPNCTMPAQNSCSGTLYQVTGPQFFGVPFDPSKRNVTAAGSMSVSFSGNNNASFTFNVGGVSRTVPIQRQLFGDGSTPQVNFTDLWFNESEPGWGIAITQQGNVMFAAWYVYDNSGNPTWFVVPNCPVNSSGDGCAGDVFQTTGPPFGPTFDPSQVTVIPAGRMVLTFTDPNNGELDYLRDSLFVSKKITRELF